MLGDEDREEGWVDEGHTVKDEVMVMEGVKADAGGDEEVGGTTRHDRRR